MPPAVDDALVRLTGADEDVLALFAERAEAVGDSVWRCVAAELPAKLAEVLAHYEAKSVTLAADQLSDGAALAEALSEAGIEVRDCRNDRAMTALYDVDAGVTGCGAALAETGTIVYRSGEAGGRGHMLVPPVHVVIVKRSDILPDMLDYMNQQNGCTPAELPAAQTFITGPSKTADIEGVLITGVHGPGKVGVIIVEDA